MARVQVDANTYALAGKQEVKGFEIGFAGHLTDKWGVFGGYTRLDSKLKDNGRFGTNANNNGNQFPNTPKDAFSLWTTYQLAPKWRVGGGLNHRGEQNPEGNRTLTADAFTTLDLMAEYQVDSRMSVKVNVTNVTDELYADSLYRGFYAPGAARSVQVALKASF